MKNVENITRFFFLETKIFLEIFDIFRPNPHRSDHAKHTVGIYGDGIDQRLRIRDGSGA